MSDNICDLCNSRKMNGKCPRCSKAARKSKPLDPKAAAKTNTYLRGLRKP